MVSGMEGGAVTLTVEQISLEGSSVCLYYLGEEMQVVCSGFVGFGVETEGPCREHRRFHGGGGPGSILKVLKAG